MNRAFTQEGPVLQPTYHTRLNTCAIFVSPLSILLFIEYTSPCCTGMCPCPWTFFFHRREPKPWTEVTYSPSGYFSLFVLFAKATWQWICWNSILFQTQLFPSEYGGYHTTGYPRAFIGSPGDILSRKRPHTPSVPSNLPLDKAATVLYKIHWNLKNLRYLSFIYRSSMEMTFVTTMS